MKKFALALALVSLAGCAKSVTKSGLSFPQTENPGTTVPTPTPTSTATPTPTPTSPVTCDPSALGELLEYAVYVKEDLTLDRVNVGRRAAANYACVQHGKIGTALPKNAARVDLASAGALGVNRAKLPNGKATYGKSLDNLGSTALGGFAKAPVDLSANLRKILAFSEACGETEHDAEVSRVCRHGVRGFSESAASPEVCSIVISGRKSLNVAQLSREQLANVVAIAIDVPKGSAIVTNLSDTQRGIFRDVKVTLVERGKGSPSPTRIFWNFPAADSIEFTGTEFLGTVVAPDAEVAVSGQSGAGGYWTRDLKGRDSNW